VWRLCLSQYGVWVCVQVMVKRQSGGMVGVRLWLRQSGGRVGVEVMVEAVWRLGVCGGYG
jgi:hypothetical protein